MGSELQSAAPGLEQKLDAAARLHNMGNLAAADAAYREILQRHPNNPDALHLLGMIALQTGQFAAAAELIGKAILGNPRDPDYFVNRCEAYRGLGRLEDALADCRKALALNPDDPATLYVTGTVHLDRNDFVEAVKYLHAAIDAEPEFAEAHNSLALALLAQNKFDEAMTHFQRATALQPEFAEAHGNLGSALSRQGKLAEAEACYQRAIELDPNDSETLFNYGLLLQTHGRSQEAVGLLDRAMRLDPRNPDIAHNLGQALIGVSALADAEKLFQKLLEARPDDAEASYQLGVCAEVRGEFASARERFEKAIATDPDHVRAQFHLAMLNKSSVDKADLPRLESLLDKSGLSDWDNAMLHFAAAGLREGLGEHDKAFAFYRTANDLRGGATIFDAEQRSAYADLLRKTLSAALLADKSNQGSHSEIPVFIVGMPRSGTTLAEQILASHPSVAGGGELAELGLVAQNMSRLIGSDESYPQCIAELEPEATSEITQAYLDVLRQVSPTAQRVTDKLPNNFQRVGLIHILFPKARIIHCRRDPMDTCLSCYFQNFNEEVLFSYDLTNIGKYYRSYRELMDHWHEVLPGRILDIEYEALVDDLEGQSRRLLDHCGLEWDPRCLDFHKTERAISTSSYQQVRQPIYRSSVQRWRHYEKHLGPLMDALGEYAPQRS